MVKPILRALFGSGRNVIAETAEVWRPNAERQAGRDQAALAAALQQFASEGRASRTWWDALVDGLNRLPRPTFAFGTVGLFAYAMADPASFAVRMEALALVPEPLWWLLGAVVTFYFGARHREKTLALDLDRHRAALSAWAEGADQRAQDAQGDVPGPRTPTVAAAPVSDAPSGSGGAFVNPVISAWRAGE